MLTTACHPDRDPGCRSAQSSLLRMPQTWSTIQGSAGSNGCPQANRRNLRYPPHPSKWDRYGICGLAMLRCPACHWLNPDSARRCCHCGHFLRRRPLPVAGSGSLARAKLNSRRSTASPAGWRKIRWDRVLASSAILGVLAGLGQLSWHWLQPLLQDPPPPGNSPQALRRQGHTVIPP